MEGAMEMIDQIYMWKRLYWQAIDRGFEPGEAGRFACRALSCCKLPFPLRRHNYRISTSFPAVAA